MCTLVVAFYPQSDYPLVVVANRDESPTRPSESWGSRTFENHSPKIFCPLDVRRGTWIGCNSFGVFCAITNWDIIKGLHGLKSRGDVVLETLKRHDKKSVFDYWRGLEAKDYKPFNILAGGPDWLTNLECDHESIYINPLSAGLHISTGWGLNQGVIREQHIKKTLRKAFYDFSAPVSHEALLKVMSDHNAGIPSEDSICVHDSEHRWETRSSSHLKLLNHHFLIQWTDRPPCHTNPDHWESYLLPLKR